MKIAFTLATLLFVTNTFAADLTPAARRKIAKSSIQSCLQGAAVSAPHLGQLDRELYCECYSKQMSAMITSEDMKYFNTNKQTSPHMQQVALTAAQHCSPR
jgi:hypothetical protein